jgi:hypothetical protein
VYDQKVAIFTISIIATVLLGGQTLHQQIVYGDEPEGCGAGYWKNPDHFDEWPVNPDDPFALVFVFSQGFFSEPPIPSYLDVLKMKGGTPMEKLGKEVLVMALNFVHLDINYGLSLAEIELILEAAFLNNDPEEILDAKDQLEFFNNMGCPF